MLDIGGWEFMIVAFVLIMVVGPKELPKMLRAFTQFTRKMRAMASEFSRGMQEMADEAEIGDIKNSITDIKSGNFSKIADKIDPGGELTESVSELKAATNNESLEGTATGVENPGTKSKRRIRSNKKQEKVAKTSEQIESKK